MLYLVWTRLSVCAFQDPQRFDIVPRAASRRTPHVVVLAQTNTASESRGLDDAREEFWNLDGWLGFARASTGGGTRAQRGTARDSRHSTARGAAQFGGTAPNRKI